jgi:hypothetical protein
MLVVVAVSFESRTARLVRELTDAYLARWRAIPAVMPLLGEAVPRWRQRRNHRLARRLIDTVAGETERYPREQPERARWRDRVRRTVQEFGERNLGWPRGYRDLLFGDEFYQATVDFTRAARAFEPEVRMEDVGQGLRNVWIANSLQMLLDLPVRLSPSIFAYSMLYPYTDNFLDDPQVSAVAKKIFARSLYRRLAGEAVVPGNPRERQVFRLIATIEEEYPRAEYPEVLRSLMAIHVAQTRSLEQQDRGSLTVEAVETISAEKGGMSVLADGYLVGGKLSRSEADFCFGYGMTLQLLDDLQDVRRDREAGHATLFSRSAEPLDGITSRLHRFMSSVLDGASRFAEPRYEPVKDLIRRNCTFLLVGAVGDAAELFTPPFLRRVEHRWPFRFAAMEKLRARAQRRYREVAARPGFPWLDGEVPGRRIFEG